LDTQSEQAAHLAKDINSIMNFVDQLRAVDTKGIAPLYHPFDLHQRLRSDAVTEEDCLAELAEIAPMFEDGLYLVPKVLKTADPS
jgi:aspartyl-tRNA(Asn)/glutamyl-tRNA(Gln) amidotransferase subunit C